MADKIKVTLIKSSIGNRKNQKENLKALGKKDQWFKNSGKYTFCPGNDSKGSTPRPN